MIHHSYGYSLPHRGVTRNGGSEFDGFSTFKNDSEVVLKGKLHGDGFSVDPNGVMAKCPSKYNAAAPAGKAGS
jgi:hypothetical protein